MALKLYVETQYGILPEAYARVAHLYGTKEEIWVQVAIHYNQEARANNMTVVKEKAHCIDMKYLKGDLMPAIYKFLKALPKYQGAVDI